MKQTTLQYSFFLIGLLMAFVNFAAAAEADAESESEAESGSGFLEPITVMMTSSLALLMAKLMN